MTLANQHHFNHLPGIGFTIAADVLVSPEGKVVPRSRFDRLEHINGRLDNLELMANAIDILDKVTAPAAERRGGEIQLESLVKHHPITASAYISLRRLQRSGEVSLLRQGLILLLAYEHDELAATDLMEFFKPHMLRGLPS